jgi:hypothetical protein
VGKHDIEATRRYPWQFGVHCVKWSLEIESVLSLMLHLKYQSYLQTMFELFSVMTCHLNSSMAMIVPSYPHVPWR